MRGCHGRLVLGVFGVFLLAFGCGSGDNVRDPRALQRILEEAMAADRMQLRGVEGEELAYAPNQDRPYTGWVADLNSGLLSEVRSALQGGVVGNLLAPDLVGDLEALGRFRRGKVVARYTWYRNRQLGLEAQYRNGEPHGVQRAWYENGSPKSEAEYRDGALHGVSKTWYEDGRPVSEAQYRNGEPHGVQRAWYENGSPKSEAKYRDGALHGVSKTWYEDGRPVSEAQYRNGKRHGLERSWFENGQLSLEVEWESGWVSGILKAWHDNGQRMAEEHYEEGRLSRAKHSEGVTRWHPNGEVAVEGILGAEGWSSLSFQGADGNAMGMIRIDAEGLRFDESVFRPLAVPSVTSLDLRRGEYERYFVSGADILRNSADASTCDNLRIWSTGENDPRAEGRLFSGGIAPVAWEDDDSGDGRNFSHWTCLQTDADIVLIDVSGSSTRGVSFKLHVEAQ